MSAALYAISPLDGRYRGRLNGVSTHLSEYAYIKYRIRLRLFRRFREGGDVLPGGVSEGKARET
jgi:hypothetical protein